MSWTSGPTRTICSVRWNWVSAEVNPIVLPERAVAKGTVWFRHGTVTDVYRSLDRAALRGGALSTERFGVPSNPAEIPPDHPLVTATTRAITTGTGTTTGVYPAHVASDIRFAIRCLGIATVGFGTLAGNFYGHNEWVNAEDMHQATRVIIRIVSAWADRVFLR